MKKVYFEPLLEEVKLRIEHNFMSQVGGTGGDDTTPAPDNENVW